MIKKTELVAELFNVIARRLQNGNKLRIVFELPEQEETEIKLSPFKFKNCRAIIAKEIDGAETIETVVEVFNLNTRRLNNGNKLSLVLENSYDKELDLKLTKLKFDNCKIFLETIEEELNFEDEESEFDEVGARL